MSAIIAEKRIVVKAIDKVTEPLALMNQRLNDLVQKYDTLSQKMQTGASGQQAFKTSLNEVKASASETAEATAKLDRAIKGLHDKKVNINANTAEANSKTEHLGSVIDKLARKSPTITPKANTSEANEQLNNLKHTTESVGHSFTRLRTIIAGTAFGTAIGTGLSTAFNNIKMGIAGAMRSGIEFDMTMQKMNATWETLTNSAGKAKSMSNSIVDLSNKLGWSVDVTNELAQQFYHVFDNQPETMKLTKSFLTMGDAIGLSSERLQQVGMDFTHMLSSSKLQLGDMNQITDAFPMFGEALLKYERKVQHNSHLTMSQLRDDISAGKISAKDAEKTFNQLGDKYKEASENLMGTLPGMFRQIGSKWKQLMGAAMAPSVDAANPIVKQVSEWIGDESTTKEFESLGKAVNNGVGSIMKALADNFGDGSVSKMLDNVVNGLTRFVKATSKWVAGNAGSIVTTIKAIASISGSLGKGFFDAVSDMLKAISGTSGHGLEGIANSLEAISKHKTALSIIGRVLAVQFAYEKLFKIASGLGLVSDGLLKIGKAKITGNIFKDIFKGAENLNKIRINPAKWFEGGKNWAKGLFTPATKEALQSGEKAGGNFITRFATKTNSSQFAQVGRSLGGRVISGVGLAIEAYDLIKDVQDALTSHNGTTRSRDAGKAIGAGLGAGIGFFFGGPAGAALGGMIGRYIGGKVGPGLGKAFNESMNFFKKLLKGDWSGAFDSIAKGFKSMWKGVTGWAKDTWKKVKDWWNGTDSSESKSKSKSSSEPSRKEIKSLGGNHYSKADIANIKEMNRAVKAYTDTLKTLKATIKKNDPTKEINSMNKSLKQAAKYWLAVSKPIKQASKSFQDMRKPLETISRSMKELTGKKSGLGTFDKDLTKLDRDLRKTKIGEEFTKLSKQIKKSDLVKTLQKLSKEVRESVKYWKELDKPLKQITTELQKFSKELKPFNSKSNPIGQLEKSVESLTKSLKKNKFGDELSKQMRVASKSMTGSSSVKSKFTSMTHAIERELTRFRSSFSRNWQHVWNGLSSSPSQGLNRVKSVVSSRLNAIISHEHSFSSKFLGSWKKWNSSVVSEMRSAFNKLPDIAQKAMSDIVSRLNRGISAINGVIGDFGGDKKLSTVHYARGTFAHPGGKAIVNDGLEPNKTELIWQPSKGWGVAQGQNVARDLEVGAMVLDAKHSQQYLGNLPRYASGTLSDEEQDKIAEQFEKDPVGASKQLMLKSTDWNSSVPIIPSLGKGLAIGMSRGIANVLKDLLGEVKEPVNGDWTRVIKSAAAKLHFAIADWQVQKLLRQIQTESGGDEKVTQKISDQNSAAGHPAQGLLQFIPSTFSAWALPGHTNIMSGFDQIMAAINCLNKGGEGGWGNVGNGHGWASGVHMTHPDVALIGDNAEHDEYVFNPYNSNALPLMQEASQVMMNHHPEWRKPSGNSFMAEMVALAKTAIEKLDNIDIHPYTTVEEVAQPVNKYNAKNYMLRS